MGTINVEIPDELHHRFRKKIVDVYGGKKGDMRKAVVEALEDWVKKKNAGDRPL